MDFALIVFQHSLAELTAKAIPGVRVRITHIRFSVLRVVVCTTQD